MVVGERRLAEPGQHGAVGVELNPPLADEAPDQRAPVAQAQREVEIVGGLEHHSGADALGEAVQEDVGGIRNGGDLRSHVGQDFLLEAVGAGPLVIGGLVREEEPADAGDEQDGSR